MLNKHYTQFQQRIHLGSFIITAEDYPFHTFCLGYLAAKTDLPLQHLFQYLEALHELRQQKIVSIILYKQFLQLLEDHPSKVAQIISTLKKVIYGSQINLIEFVQSFYSKKFLEEVNEKQLMVASKKNKPTEESNSASIQHIDNTIPLEHEGTQQLQDLFDQSEPPADSHHHFNHQQDIQKMDIEMARKMQEEFNNEYKAPVEEDCPCEICYMNLFDEEVETLECGDIFHKNCLIETYKSNISSNTFPLRCPNDQCKVEVSERDLRNIFPDELFDKYQQHTLKAYADEHGDSISWCPTANCGYMFFHEKGDPQRFECLECHKQYCLNCRVQWHKDMSCKEYKITNTVSQDDQKFMDFVKGKKFKQCPKCKFWVQKNDGCDHMTCKCKFEFCYKCGGVYMKCQCLENQRLDMQNRRRLAEERARRKIQRKQEIIRKRQQKQQNKRAKQEKKKQKEMQKAEPKKSNRRK